jgi:uncharacterized membrane protein YozB (DUF420 family)
MDKILLSVLSIVLSLGTILIVVNMLVTKQASSMDQCILVAFSVALIFVAIIKNKHSWHSSEKDK